jgi:hypothetical protein
MQEKREAFFAAQIEATNKAPVFSYCWLLLLLVVSEEESITAINMGCTSSKPSGNKKRASGINNRMSTKEVGKRIGM